MVLAKVWTLSAKEVFHCIATSRLMFCSSEVASMAMTEEFTFSLEPMRNFT